PERGDASRCSLRPGSRLDRRNDEQQPSGAPPFLQKSFRGVQGPASGGIERRDAAPRRMEAGDNFIMRLRSGDEGFDEPDDQRTTLPQVLFEVLEGALQHMGRVSAAPREVAPRSR